MILQSANNFEDDETIGFDMEDTMIEDKNRMYYAVSDARKISFRAHVRSLSEEIKKRKHLRKVEGLTEKICVQLREMKGEVRYLNLVRAYLRGIDYKTIEKSTSEQKKVSPVEMVRLVKHYVSPWQGKFHDEEALSRWLNKE